MEAAAAPPSAMLPAADEAAPAALYGEYGPLWAAEEADRAPRWESFLAELADERRGDASRLVGDPRRRRGRERGPIAARRAHPRPIPIRSPSSDPVDAGLAALNAMLAAWRASGNAVDAEDPPPWLARLRSLAQAGAPLPLRGRVWAAFLGLDAKAVPGEYERLVADAERAEEEGEGEGGGDADPPVSPASAARSARRAAWATAVAIWDAQVDKDIPRTLAGHPTLAAGDRRAALRRVLVAYARRAPSVGYCQGMNLMAGVLLLFLGEEEAFWGLATLIENVLPGYHAPGLAAARVDAAVLADAVGLHFPALAARLESLGVTVAAPAARWLLAAFVGSLPLETALRVWDVLLLERGGAPLLRTGLAVVDIYTRALAAAADAADAAALLADAPALTYDGSRLLDVAGAGYGHVTGAALEEWRAAVRERGEGGDGGDDADKPPLLEPPTPAARVAAFSRAPSMTPAPTWDGGVAEFAGAALAHAAAGGAPATARAPRGRVDPAAPSPSPPRPARVVKGASHPPRYEPPPPPRRGALSAAAAVAREIARPRRAAVRVDAEAASPPPALTEAGARLAGVAAELGREVRSAAARRAAADADAAAAAADADAAATDAGAAREAADRAAAAAGRAATAAETARAAAAAARSAADATAARVDAARSALATRRMLLAEKEAVIADVASRVARARAAAGGGAGGGGLRSLFKRW